MFGIAIGDAKQQVFMLVRDRVGKKPLYYTCRGRTVVFGSKIKCLFKMPGIEPGVEAEYIDEYFSLGYVLAPNTLFRGIKKLRPLHYLKLTLDNIEEKYYWDIPKETAIYKDENEA